MSEKFKAIIILDNQNEKFTREIKEIDTSSDLKRRKCIS